MYGGCQASIGAGALAIFAAGCSTDVAPNESGVAGPNAPVESVGPNAGEVVDAPSAQLPSGGAPNVGGASNGAMGGAVTGEAGGSVVGAPAANMSSGGSGGSEGGSAPLASGGSRSSGGVPSVPAPEAGAGGEAGRVNTGGAGVGGVNAGGASAGAANGGTAGNSEGMGGAPIYPEGVDPKFLIFLLLGQSNMVGQPQPESQDRDEDPRIKVLAYDNCSNVGREYNQWYTASPPLHQCDAGVGPGDYFAKTLLESLPEGYTIGLVPLAVNGAPIDVFRKGVPRPGWELPPDNHWETGYEWIVSRANEAQKVGVIRGILFHQGESNYDAPEWPGQVEQLVVDLRTDLGIGEVPFLAGELYYDGCCESHNALVEELTGSLSNGFLISADGLTGFDTYHFDLAGQREFGRRYGMAMQGALTLP